MEKISNSKKKAIKMLMETAKQDVRSITGNNYRNIMLLVGKSSVDDVKKVDVEKIEYFPVKETDSWKVDAIREIIEVKNKVLDVEDFLLEELEAILDHLCTS